jgi:SAM-dependent methyltransferase
VPLAQANLEDPLPVRGQLFDAVLCALVGEHLTRLSLLFREFFHGLTAAGRLVFSVFHPDMAAAGIEANFERNDVEFRLGAERHTVDDYLNRIDEAGFRKLRAYEFSGDQTLVNEVPWASKYLGRPLMLVVEATKG